MCVVFFEGDLTNTDIHVGLVKKVYVPKVGCVVNNARLLIYGNTAETFRNDQGVVPTNVMIIPVPAKDLWPINFEEMSHILRDMREAVQPVMRSMGKGIMALGIGDFEIEAVGLYTVVTAQSVSGVEAALAQLWKTTDLRPEVNKEVVEAYRKMYPNWPITLWVWQSDSEQESQPIGILYEPRDPDSDWLYVPGTDAHDGGAPRKGLVEVDHWITASVYDMVGGELVRYSDRFEPSWLEEILPTRVLGGYRGGREPNGDWWVSISNLRKGKFNMVRMDPPGGFVR